MTCVSVCKRFMGTNIQIDTHMYIRTQYTQSVLTIGVQNKLPIIYKRTVSKDHDVVSLEKVRCNEFFEIRS